MYVSEIGELGKKAIANHNIYIYIYVHWLPKGVGGGHYGLKLRLSLDLERQVLNNPQKSVHTHILIYF